MKLNTKNLTHFLLIGAMACAVALTGGNALAADAKPNPITAIDILLEPDATMIEHATATNERLLKVFPKGFALDASHRPHITLVQRFVLTENLDKVYAAVGKVFASANVTGLKLEAFKYYYIPDKDLGVSGIVIKPTPELLTLEKQVIDAVTPFAVKTGTSAAFVTTPEDPNIIPPFPARITIRTSPPASPRGLTSTKCSRNRLKRSPFRPRARPFTTSATSAPRRRNSKNGI